MVDCLVISLLSALVCICLPRTLMETSLIVNRLGLKLNSTQLKVNQQLASTSTSRIEAGSIS
ncbi:hypothetical protein IQ258_16870 [Coleofasciculus sp. LEGE 07081]|nr:hypothetical protein [Coleofasciculus sp. LEGE 07081]